MTWRGTGVLVAAVIAIAALTGCSDDSSKDLPKGDGDSSTVTTPAGPTPEEAAIAAYTKYHEIRVSAQNAGSIRPTAFDGVAEGPHVEQYLRRMQGYEKAGYRRIGTPVFTDYQAEIAGSAAKLSVCFDESAWAAEAKGVDMELPPIEPIRIRHLAELRDGTGIITASDARSNEAEPC